MSNINDLYEQVTNKIIADLEKGELTWRKPWNSDNLSGFAMRPLRACDIPYTGINTLLLWIVAEEKGYRSPYWMTFKQALDMKAHVRKGEKSATVVYTDTMVREERDADGVANLHKIPFLKKYAVFNADQIDGLPEAFYKSPEPPASTNPEQRIEVLERFFRETKAKIVTGGKASYSPFLDRIQMPPFECFDDAASYYGTLAHETIHWVGHPSRLNREFNSKSGNKEGYAKEELIAELGACFLAADLGFEPVTREEHAAYIQSWLKILHNDKRFIFHAAALAQRAVEYVNGLQEEAPSEDARVRPKGGPEIGTKA